MLDEILPTRLTVRLVVDDRLTDPCFNADCRTAKHLTGRLEPALLAASRRAVTAANGPTATSPSAAVDTARKL